MRWRVLLASSAQEAAEAYDAAVRLHLETDAQCNFERSDSRADVPMWERWEPSKALGVKRVTKRSRDEEPQDAGAGGAPEESLAKQRHLRSDDAIQANGGAREACAEPEGTAACPWSEAQWSAFRKRMVRERAAADETDASLRRSLVRCRFRARHECALPACPYWCG